MTQKKKKRIIVVLGMHRSGTSAITRGLAALGVDLGNYLIPPMEGNNETGFWEDIDVNTFDNELLAFLGHAWHTLTPIQPAELERPDLAAFKLRAVELLRKKMRGVPVFGMKDPRVAILLPFWQDVFRHVGAEVSYVIAVRHPLSVVRSLNKRDGFDPEKSYYLWLEHMVPCLLKSAGSLRVVVDFDLLMEQPEQQLRRLAEVLGLPFDGRTSAVKEYTKEFLRDDLRHTRFHLDDLKLDPSVPLEAVSAFEMLTDLSNDRLDAGAPEVQTFFQTLEQRLATLRPALNYMTRQDEQLAGLRQTLTGRDQTLAGRDEQLAGLSENLAERAAEIATLSQAVAVKDQDLAGRDAQLAELNKEIAERNGQIAALAQEVAKRDEKVAALSQTVTVKDQDLAGRDARLAGLNKEIAERNGQIAALAQEVAERDEKVAALSQTVADKDQDLAGRDEQVASLSQKITVFNQTVQSRNEQIAGLNQTVAERDARIAELDQETAKRDENISVLNQTLAERTAALAGRGAQIDRLRQEVAGRDEQIAGLNQIANEKVVELAARNKQIVALSQTLAERTAALAGRGAQIDRLRQEVAGRDEQIASLTQTLSERDKQITALNRTAAERDAVLAERDIQIDGLLKNIAELNSQIAGLSQSLTDRDAQIAALNQTVIERDQSLAGRDAQIGGLNQAVAERDGRIGQFERQLSDVQTLLNSVLASPSWKITEPLRWFRRNLITRPLKWIRQTPEKWVQKAWHRSNLPVDKKEKIKAVVFGLFPTFLGGTAAFKLWKQVHIPPQSITAQNISPKTCYTTPYQEEIDFRRLKTDIKALAFYLPQFHRIPENDEWWGNGFTEWTNTKASSPRFPGHYQPRTPHKDIGYYDLSDIETLKKQAQLAKRHGIYGFCFYYYWFDGKRLLERPGDLLIEHPEIDISFCLCWANENWTRAWDGQAREILIQQNYSPENDLRFIADLKKYMDDPRYIRVSGKPVLLVYNSQGLPHPDETFDRWRQWCRNHGVGEIEIWAARTFFNDCNPMGLKSIDHEVEFPPHRVATLEQIDPAHIGLTNLNGHLYDYNKLVDSVLCDQAVANSLPFPIYRTAMMGWDNSARRKDGFSVWYGFSQEKYYKWLRKNIEYTRLNFPPDRRFVFINAWNEWAEGTYLEPDESHGYANINTTSKALFDLPLHSRTDFFSPGEVKQGGGFTGTIAVHAHIYYPEMLPELAGYINNIPYKFDLFITTDTRQKKCEIRRGLHQGCKASKIKIMINPNIGRDIAPFVIDCRDAVNNYDYICHIHTKKSDTVYWGDCWRRYLLDNLLGSEGLITALLDRFEADTDLGLLFPPAFPVMKPFMDWGGNYGRCVELMQKSGLAGCLPETPLFSVGNMFWAKTKAIKAFFNNAPLTYSQFEEEAGQIQGTLAHAIERLWVYIAESSGYKTCVSLPQSTPVRLPAKKRIAFFVHHNSKNTVAVCDIHYIEKLSQFVDEMIVISNSPIPEVQRASLKKLCSLIERDNIGYDFGAWRDGLVHYGFENLAQYDEVIFANNSCYGPVYPFEEMFGQMEKRNCDFWGVAAFPAINDSKRAEAQYLRNGQIPKHIQSFFMVLKKPVVESSVFADFWTSVTDETDILKVVAKYEVSFTKLLEKHGFRAGCYIEESLPLQERNAHVVEFNAIYNLPADFLILRCPLIKKKIKKYAPDQITEVHDLVRKIGHYPPDLLNELT